MFTASFFTANRRRLYAELPPDGFVVLSAHAPLQRTVDLPLPFVQESNFWYLTGVDEPDWWLVADLATSEEWLVAPHLSAVQIAFDGSLSPHEATNHSGVHNVLDRKAGLALIKRLCAQRKKVFGLQPHRGRYYGNVPNPAQQVIKKRLIGPAFVDIRLQLSRQRAIKQSVEIAAIQKSIDITAAGLQVAHQEIAKLQYEYQVAAILDYEFRFRGAAHAFEPIVAYGAHTCTFHYEAKKAPLGTGLVLFDVGARADHYAADIGRVMARGEPTERQQAIFAAVARAQKEIIGLLHAGKSVKEYLLQMQEIMLRELLALGLLPSTAKPADIYTNMQHAISHGLGIDAHDSLGQPKVFAENMVITVEPGIYDAQAQCGIRLEDDILITKTGVRNLSETIPSSLKI